MATEVGSAYVTLIPSARGFGAKMQSELGNDIARVGDSGGREYGDKFSKSASTGIKGKAKSIFGGIAKAGPLVAAAAGVAVAKVISGSLEEARDAQVVGARTENVIKSMGNAAGISAKGVADLAGALSNKTAVDDEAIQAGQNLLLTFGNVRNEVGKGNDIFNQTSGLMVDMSKAMGTDVKGSAIQLGKALNDPVKGVSALTRVGVSFTEQQKEQIKRLQESGDTLGAQKIVLGEVEKQFGGAAAAMSTPAERAQVAWGNFQESIGTALLPTVDKILTALADALPKVIEFGQKMSKTLGPVFARIRDAVEKVFAAFGGAGGGGELSKFVETFRSAFADVKQIISGVIQVIVAIWQSGWGERFITVLKAAFAIIRDVISGALRIVKGIINVVLGVLTGDWAQAWDGIKQILSGVWQIIKSLIKNGLTIVKTVISNGLAIARGIFARAWDLIKTLVSKGVSAVVDYVRGIPGKLRSALSSLASTLRDLFSRAFDAARETISNAASRIIDFVRGIPGRLRDLGSSFLSAGSAIIGAFVDGLKNAGGVVSDIAGNIWSAVKGLLNDAIGRINAALEFTINLPGPDITINPPNIPTLASGGRATGATLAVIGEGREPETVLPDSMLRGLLERAAAAGNGRGQIAQLTITNWREGTGFFRVLADDAVRDDASFRRDIGVMHA